MCQLFVNPCWNRAFNQGTRPPARTASASKGWRWRSGGRGWTSGVENEGDGLAGVSNSGGAFAFVDGDDFQAARLLSLSQRTKIGARGTARAGGNLVLEQGQFHAQDGGDAGEGDPGRGRFGRWRWLHGRWNRLEPERVADRNRLIWVRGSTGSINAGSGADSQARHDAHGC